LGRSEDGRAEQPVTLGFERAVVDGLGLFHFAERPRTDQVRRGERDLDRVEIQRLALLVEQVKQIFHGILLSSAADHLDLVSSSSMLIASERISLTRTLNDSGMPATISWSPSTMFLYIWLRPDTSSDLTVSISCSV